MLNIEDGRGAGRGRVAGTSISQEEGPAEVGKVIVQFGTTGGLSGVDCVQETAGVETLLVLAETGQGTRGTRQDQEKEAMTGQLIQPGKLPGNLIML